MVQTAKVTRVLADGRAEVAVKRQSACGHDCSKCGGGCSELMVSSTVAVIAANPVRAMPGDMVTVESSTSRVLGAAVIVYLVPFLLFFAGYFLCAAFRLSSGVSAAVGVAGFALGLLLAVLWDRRVRLLHYRHCAGGLMFGYVRPNRDELKVRELRDYEALYCGLCHALGRRHGFFARFFLNYDFTFLAMLLDGSKPTAEQKRCPARLWCRKKGCICAGSVDAAADAGTILSYWKLRDTVADGPFWKGTAARVLSFLLRPGYRRAAQARPEFDRAVHSCLEELQALEQEGSPSLDRTADTFARILAAAALPAESSARTRALEQLLYHVGRWIYLVDAWDDLEEDGRTGSYNPIAARFPEQVEANRDYLRTTLLHSLNLARSACALLELGHWQGAVENILYLGLPMVEEMVFTGRWKAVNHQNRRRIS